MYNFDFLITKLEVRDKAEKQQLPYFAAFEVASERALHGTAQDRRDQANSQSENVQEKDISQDDDIINRLKESRRSLERQMKTLQSQLDHAQERARAVAEEQYLKTNVVHSLHDEILALSLQLNLSEEKRKKLQDELGR